MPNKNALIVYRDVAGLHCECGNGELITDSHPKYETFYYTWSTRSGSGKALGYCLKCDSELQEPKSMFAPADQREDLLKKYGPQPSTI